MNVEQPIFEFRRVVFDKLASLNSRLGLLKRGDQGCALLWRE
jgi:hypothetical protein